jgi:hypothetical protein
VVVWFRRVTVRPRMASRARPAAAPGTTRAKY